MAFGSRAAAVLKGGVHVCTTPNHNALYQPPMGNTDVSLHSDCQYGIDDYLLWTQHYLKEYPYLAAILAKPTDPNDPLLCMWWDVTAMILSPYQAMLQWVLDAFHNQSFRASKNCKMSCKLGFLEHKATKKTPPYCSDHNWQVHVSCFWTTR